MEYEIEERPAQMGEIELSEGHGYAPSYGDTALRADRPRIDRAIQIPEQDDMA